MISQVTGCSKTSGACLINEMYGMRGRIPAVYINKFANRVHARTLIQRQGENYQPSSSEAPTVLVGLGCDDGSV